MLILHSDTPCQAPMSWLIIQRACLRSTRLCRAADSSSYICCQISTQAGRSGTNAPCCRNRSQSEHLQDPRVS